MVLRELLTKRITVDEFEKYWDSLKDDLNVIFERTKRRAKNPPKRGDAGFINQSWKNYQRTKAK